MSSLKNLGVRSGVLFRSVRELSARQRRFLTSEIVQVRGLMPLLMKQRNNEQWTPEEKQELAMHLRRLSSISPYLVVLAIPGGLLLLPMLAWWLDRRRNRKRTLRPL
jgi:hypothetical protein